MASNPPIVKEWIALRMVFHIPAMQMISGFGESKPGSDYRIAETPDTVSATWMP